MLRQQDSYAGRSANRIYNFGYMLTQFDVLTALSTEQMRSRNRQVDFGYATAVFISYINAKLAKGRSRFEVSNKLMELERGLPQFVRSFHEARARTGLPASPIFPPLRDGPSSPSSSSRPGTISRPSNNATATQGPNVGSISRSRVETVRPTETVRPAASTSAAAGAGTGNPEDGSGELPPPPYSREDPEPEMTQVLARQLSQLDESGRSGGGGGVGLERVVSSASANIRQQGQSGRPSVDSNRRASAAGNGNGTGNGNGSSLSPAEREQLDLERAIEASRQESHGPSDLGPAVSTHTEPSMSDSMHGMSASERREYQQAVEESRRLAGAGGGGAAGGASFAQGGAGPSGSSEDDGLTAQERSELREVMEESKRQAEEDERRRRQKEEEADRARAGPSTIPMPGAWNDSPSPSGFKSNNSYNTNHNPHQPGSSNAAFLSRRESNPSFSNTPAPLPSLFLPGHEGQNSPQGRHRRAISDYKRPDSLVGGMGGMNLLDEQDEAGSGEGSGAGRSAGMGMGLAEPLKPTPTGMGTGTTTGSRNPFLDPGTPTRNDASSSPGPSPVSGKSRNPFANPEAAPEQPEAETETPRYAPPPGPPPGHPSLQQQATGQPLSSQAGYDASSSYQAHSFQLQSPQTPLTPSHTNNPFLQPRSHSPQPPQPPPKPSGPSPSFSQQQPQEYATGNGAMQAPPIPARPEPGQRGDIVRQTSLRRGETDPLEVLTRFDTIILVDDSGSMAGGRWRQTKDALMDVCEQAAKYDQDGLDIYFINNQTVREGLRSAEDVARLFDTVKPGGQTPLGAALQRVLGKYMHDLEISTDLERRGELPSGEGVKPVNLIVITDGAPTDNPEDVLVSYARRLDEGGYPLTQLGIQLVQIGNENEAREALQELDDSLTGKHEVRDIVDTVLYDGSVFDADLIIKRLLGGINRRIDQ